MKRNEVLRNDILKSEALVEMEKNTGFFAVPIGKWEDEYFVWRLTKDFLEGKTAGLPVFVLEKDDRVRTATPQETRELLLWFSDAVNG